MTEPVTKRELRNELENYVRKQHLEDELHQLPYLNQKGVREIAQNEIRLQWVRDQKAASKEKLIAGLMGLIGGLISSGLLDFFG